MASAKRDSVSAQGAMYKERPRNLRKFEKITSMTKIEKKNWKKTSVKRKNNTNRARIARKKAKRETSKIWKNDKKR